MRLDAPGKINLSLRVVGRRADGFHLLDSRFVLLELADRLLLLPGCSGLRVEGEGVAGLPLDATNLAWRGLIAGLGDEPHTVCLALDKRIPVASGLGGGSSDAAAVLRCLARAFRIRDAAALAEIALEIGSDVPFFLGPGPAWAEGRGEDLTPADVPPQHLVLVYPADPALAIRAGDAYRWLDATRQGRRPRLAPRFARFEPSLAGNDLEPPCVGERPRLATLLGLLVGRGAAAAIMSGSGPTVFGLFPDRNAAARAARALAEEIGERDVTILAARTVRRHPGVTPWRSPRFASSP